MTTVIHSSSIMDSLCSNPSQREETMSDLGAVVAMLKKERDKLDRAIAALSGLTGNSGVGGERRKMSAAARERIAAAQRKRWAKLKAKKGQQKSRRVERAR